MTIKRRLAFSLLSLVALMGLVVPAAWAFHAETGLNIIPVLVTNSTGADVTNRQVGYNLSSKSLIDAQYIDADVFNANVQEGTTDLAFMPGTGQVQVLACFNNIGTDETTKCNSPTDSGGDLVLPAAAAEVYEIAFDSQSKHLWMDIGTAAVGTWTVVWEYWNGSSYVAFSNVNDGTVNFTVDEVNRVSWDFPAEGLWVQSTLHSIPGYWIRARVSAFTSLSQVPFGEQAWYETGRWWLYTDGVGSLEQKRFDTHLDVAPTSGSINPSIAASADDALTAGNLGGVYPPNFSVVTDAVLVRITRSFDGAATYTIRDGFLRFDTSAIPDDASVTSGTLECTVQSAPLDDDSRSIVAEWYPWEGIEDFDYITTAAATQAITGTAISTIGAGVNSFTLNNLHRINRVGYTGLRMSISGGVPTGDNQVDIDSIDTGTPCSLNLSYADKTFHYYFPHQDGYTLADNASLEPGNAFEITVAGYIDPSNDNGIANIVSKSTDFRIRAGAAVDAITVDVSGTATVLGSSPFTAGYHEITVRQSGVGASDEIILLVDGNEVSSASSTGVPIPDNATDWTFFDGNGVYSAMDYIDYDVSGTQQFIHQLRDIPDYNLENHANPGTFDANTRYPDTTDDFSVTLQSAEAGMGAVAQTGAPEIVGVTAPLDNFATVPAADGSSFWLLQIFQDEATETGFPYEAILGMFVLAFVVMIMIVAARAGLTHPLFIGGMAITTMVILWLMGALPAWYWYLFALIPFPFFLLWKHFRAA